MCKIKLKILKLTDYFLALSNPIKHKLLLISIVSNAFTLTAGQRNRASDHILVIGDAAVDHSLFAGVDYYEGEVDDGVGRWRPVCLLLCLSVPLNKVLKGYLLQENI